MSSILDAVTKDASRSGSIPGAAGPSPSSPGPGGSRLRSAVLVVVLGVLAGGVAARMFGGGEPLDDDLLTEKTSGEGAAVPMAKADDKASVAPKARDAGRPSGKGRDGARKGDDARAKGAHRKEEGARRPADAGQAKVDAPLAPAVPAAPAVAPPAPRPLVIPAPAAPPSATEPPALEVAKTQPEPAIPAEPEAAKILVAPVDPAAAPDTAATVVAEPPVAAVAPSAAAPVAPAPSLPGAVVAGAPSKAPAAEAPTIVTGLTAEPEGTVVEPVAAEAATSDAVPADAVMDEPPAGAPEVSILFVAWSRTPAERLASMRIGTGSLSVVHEGEYVEGLQVSAIHAESVDFQWTGQKFRVPVREF